MKVFGTRDYRHTYKHMQIQILLPVPEEAARAEGIQLKVPDAGGSVGAANTCRSSKQLQAS
jgi:hypothetical protein